MSDPVGVDYLAGREPLWADRPEGSPCPSCGHRGLYVFLDGKIQCTGCDKPRRDLTRTEEGKIMAKGKKAKNGRANGHAKHDTVPVGESDHARLLADGGVERAPFTQELPVRIGDAEVATLADALAKTVRERESLREERREAMASYRERENGIADREKKLAESVEKHTELRQVECVEILTKQNEVCVIRLDTGEEVESRAATSEDLQEGLSLDHEENLDEGDEVAQETADA